MATPPSSEELIQVIRKSALIDESRLETFLQGHRSQGGLPSDPRKLASLMVRDGLITFFQAEQYLLGKWRGFTIGKYKLLERVGFGSMGPVFLCEHLYMRRRVAIKILPPTKAEEPAALGRFYREARASGSMNHPNIVRTHDIDQDGNLHFMVMEYVDGSSLLEMVKKCGPLSVDRAAHYFRHAAEGLDHAYKNGLVHRDIKPGNIMVSREGVAKILDMGLARFYKDTQDQLTIKYDENNVLGTADYVAPEQTVNSHDVDHRADIYSLGATMYFVLAGHPLFPEGIASQKLLWHRTREPRSIREVRPEVPEGIAAIIEKMLAKDPDQRYQEPSEIVEALKPFTRAPIDVPDASEMPQLSPAALAPPDAVPPESMTPTPGRGLPPGAGVPRAQPQGAGRFPEGLTPPTPVGGRNPAGFEPIRLDDTPAGFRPAAPAGGPDAVINLRETPEQPPLTPAGGIPAWIGRPAPSSGSQETSSFAGQQETTPPPAPRPSMSAPTPARHPFKAPEPAPPPDGRRTMAFVIFAAIVGSIAGVAAYAFLFK